MKIYVLTIHNPGISFGPQLRLEGFFKEASKHGLEFFMPKFCEPAKHSKLKTLKILLDSLIFLIKNRKKIDLIHVVSPPSYPGLVAILAKKILGIKYIVDIGDPCAENMALIKNLSKKSLRFKFAKSIDKILYKNASHLILTSKEIEKYIPTHPPHTTILTGLNSSSAITQKELPQNKKCLYIGNYGPLQNLEYIIRVFAEAIKEDAAISLHIVGNGEREHLEELVRELQVEKSIRFFDPVPPSEIPNLALDYVCGVVSLSLNESLNYAIPTKLLTYLTLGLPVFGTGGKAVEDLIRKAEAGVINSKSLLNLLNNRENLLNYSKNATSFARQNLTFENCANSYAEICKGTSKIILQ
ncbi:MAG: glycosyltransferase [Candidatus Gracilibacteria bacterium]